MRRLPWFVLVLALVLVAGYAVADPVINIKPKAFSASTPVTQSQVTGLTAALAGKASTGANSTITSLSGLTTPLSVAQGGTAGTTAATARTALGFKVSSCTLDGAATPTCTVTGVTALSVCTCSYASASLPHIVACALSSTTVTVISATALDAGVVNVTCISP